MPQKDTFDDRIKRALESEATKQAEQKAFLEKFSEKEYKAALVNQLHERLLHQFGYTDYRGSRMPIDEALKQSINSILAEGAESYNTWIACQMSLVGMAKLLQQDITFANLSVGPAAWAAAAIAKVGTSVEQGVDLVSQGVDLKAKYQQLIGKPPEVGDLYATVDMDDSNKLIVKDLASSLNLPISEQLQDYFKSGIIRWLDLQGYTEDAQNPGQYHGARGEALDRTTFNQLKADPTDGLEVFLSGRYDMPTQLKSNQPGS